MSDPAVARRIAPVDVKHCCVSCERLFDATLEGRPDNCIGSYSAVAVDHRSYLLGVYRDSELLANAEMLPDGTLRQLFGRFNQPLEASMDEAVSAAILANAAPALTSAHQALELAA